MPDTFAVGSARACRVTVRNALRTLRLLEDDAESYHWSNRDSGVLPASFCEVGSLSTEERRGIGMFRGKARSIQCDAGPNLTEALP